MTAYTLGLRHAFDADHISAIDGTTRKLMAEGKRPLSVGFWFSLGHSTIVFALVLLISIGARWLDGPVKNGHSTLHQATSYVGTAVSGGFLYLIAALNIVILHGIVKVFREMRSGRYDEAALDRHLDSRGLMDRLFGRLTRVVVKPRAAGMSMMDSIDGSFMNFAYGWALSKPVRKVFYNLTITGLSVAVALVIGTIEVGGLVSSELDLSAPFWNWLENVDVEILGFVIVAMFIATWVIAFLVWRLGRIEERWSTHLDDSTSHATPPAT